MTPLKRLADPEVLKQGSEASSSAPSSPMRVSSVDNAEEFRRVLLAPNFGRSRKRLTKQLSMCETPRDIAWEKRRRRTHRKSGLHVSDDITDEDLNELKGCIELGFGFKEEDGQQLCNTLPALDLYFAVNRQVSPSPESISPNRRSTSSLSSLGAPSPSLGSPNGDSQAWKICNPGEDPQQVKTRLRHWAQAVACAVMQSH